VNDDGRGQRTLFGGPQRRPGERNVCIARLFGVVATPSR
jgi:hypothetical protein